MEVCQLVDWKSTRESLQRLTDLLICSLCHEALKEPCNFELCDHYFCRKCALDLVDKNSNCPECNSALWKEQLQQNLKIPDVYAICERLKELIAPKEIEESTYVFMQDTHEIAQNYEENNEKSNLDENLNTSTVNEDEVCLSGLCTITSTFDEINTSSKNLHLPLSFAAKCEERLPANEGSVSEIKTKRRRFKKPKIRYGESKRLKLQDILGPEMVCRKSDGEDVSFDENNLEKRREELDFPPENLRTKSSSKKLKNLTKRNNKGETSLHTACIKGQLKLAEELLQIGSDPNTKDNAGWTPLHEACNHGSTEIVKILLEHGAIIDMVAGDDNDTPLHDAVTNNRLDVVHLLLQRGAPINIRNSLGHLPIDYARTSDMKEVFSVNSHIKNVNCSSDSLATSNPSIAKVILTTNLRKEDRVEVSKCSELFGAELVEGFSPQVTHVVCGMTRDARTMKYLMGLLTGKWLLSYKWIADSLERKEWQDESLYETVGNTEVARRSRVNAWKSLPRLFDGCSFYLSGTFDWNLPKERLTSLIKMGGGKVLLREPKTSNVDPLITPVSPLMRRMNIIPRHCSPVVIYHTKSGSSQLCCSQYIIYDPKMSPGHKQLFSPVLCSAPVSWLLDCISNFAIIDISEDHDTKVGYKSSQE